VSAGTFRSTVEDSSPPYRKLLPIIEALFATIATQLFSSDISKCDPKTLSHRTITKIFSLVALNSLLCDTQTLFYHEIVI